MSATATPSDAPAKTRARRSHWAPRWLVLTHRYLGVVLGALMLLWCLSGMVMLFVSYPSVSPDDRLGHLPRIQWSRCCTFGDTVPLDARVSAAMVEQLGDSPILKLRLQDGERTAIDLSNGRPLDRISDFDARGVTQSWGRAKDVTPVIRDQWTVSGEFNRQRPFWRVRLDDGEKTDLYVSQKTGEVAQRTTQASRILNWVGAVPHWLYPTILRQYPKAWTQVVIWTSLAGTFLTVVGLYLGLISWRPFRDDRLTPFQGLMAWHHLAGLATGVLTLTWVFSGLVSMNPWGFLDSPDDPARGRIAGPPPNFEALQGALESTAAHLPPAGQARLAPIDGRVFVVTADRRFDELGHPTPLRQADLALAAHRLGDVADQRLMDHEDRYYFSHHDTVALPVWRVILRDGRRYYLDPRSAAVLADIDADAKGYRWLHEGLHRLDVIPGLRRGPIWAFAVLALLAAVTFGVGTGVWLGWRRIGQDFARLRRP
jgi:uncharacterized iron-regulated membrane protein